MALSSPVVAQSHYEGKTHMKNLKLRQQGGIPEGTLLQTKKPIVRKPTVAAKTEDPLDSTKFCTLCHATFNNPLMAEQHYKGKKHKKQETKSQLMTIYTSSVNSLPQAPPPTVKGPSPGSESDFFSVGKGYSCDTCSIVLNSIEQYQAHISGLKHKNQILSMTSSSVECQPPAGGTSFTGALSSSGLPPSLVGAVAMGCPPSLDNPLTEGLSASGSATYGGLQQPPYAPPHNNQPYIHEDLMGRNDYNYYSKDC
ncbi:hypothetical protein GDO86_005561 [Hymenochirus boettgeri]|uniref:Zinc finger protein 346 n=1 Tax=Hymenochirus boettgeri TaxID=247094 RepID=A0A8T2J4Y9_9PIPI|nr:hypothetical protein GDO86_005561 [Hymenochirus boettgeri]